jgi:pheromone shutdown protein TraB
MSKEPVSKNTDEPVLIGRGSAITLEHPKTKAKYWILGTYGMSDSSDTAKSLIKTVEPDAIAIEIAENKLGNIIENQKNPSGQRKEMKEVITLTHPFGDALLILSTLAFLNVSKFLKMAQKGDEKQCIVLLQEAKARNIPVFPIDIGLTKMIEVCRSVGITPLEFRRISNSLFGTPAKNVNQKTVAEISKGNDMHLNNDFINIDARNKYMALKLYNLGETHSKIVGLVEPTQLGGLEKEFAKLSQETQNNNNNIPLYTADTFFVEPRHWREQWYALFLGTFVGSFLVIRTSHRASKKFFPYYGRGFVPAIVFIFVLRGFIRGVNQVATLLPKVNLELNKRNGGQVKVNNQKTE